MAFASQTTAAASTGTEFRPANGTTFVPAFDERARILARQPARRLALAVLQRAALDLLGYCRAKRGGERKLFLDARRWISTRDRSSCFTFDSICDLADIDGRRLRRRLLSLAESVERHGLDVLDGALDEERLQVAHGMRAGGGQRLRRS